ncbi:thermostable hemolysin [Parvibaculum sp.]|jgi:hypothetical protein|uniref:thermostable hemolysin n=1 Tax=Parvibaculum sp. TaxID=2024848 RepID=UPI001B0790F0|nr:thermostable hemolysin [Parvibaculum sp.]MBO6679873.1 thermostable hemolysin [Parvibaculum sp.]
MLVEPENAARPAVETFIRSGYARTYDARLAALPSRLFAVLGNDGAPLAAAGLRLHEDGFFSEAYLDTPLEILAAALGHAFERTEFLEVTTLVSATPFALFPLMAAMLAWGRERSLGCGVFTATAPLRKLFSRLGIPFVPLVAADPARLPNAVDWGRYYERDPWVCLMPNPSAPATCLLPRSRLNANLAEARLHG